MNEKWVIGIIICAVIYVVLDFIKDGYKENAIKNGMNEKEAREHYKWKNIFHSVKKASLADENQDFDVSAKKNQTLIENEETGETEEEHTDESGEDESMPEMSKHLYW